MGRGVVTDHINEFDKVQVFHAGVAGGKTKKYSADGNILPSQPVVILDVSGGALAMTLADAKMDGFEMTLVQTGAALTNAVVTPSNLVGFTTVTLDNPGESVKLKFSRDAGGWIIVGGNAYAAA